MSGRSRSARLRAAAPPPRPLPESFYAGPTLEVARKLLGCTLCRRLDGGRVLRGRIVEVEAYEGPVDRASHAFRGRTPRNAPMFEQGGIAYVYQVYGVHFCLNVVTGPADYPAAVLLRATEPPEPGRSASGPGRLCRAFEIDRSHDGSSLLDGPLWIERSNLRRHEPIRRTGRIGVDYAGPWADAPYRFVLGGHPDVSGPKRLR